MATTDMSGYWKGLAVTRTMHAVVHLYLDQTENEIKGKFEAPEMPGENSKGDLRGSIREGGALTLEVTGKMIFRGQVAGQAHAQEIIHGLMQRADEQMPVGTLTIFRGAPSEAPLMY